MSFLKQDVRGQEIEGVAALANPIREVELVPLVHEAGVLRYGGPRNLVQMMAMALGREIQRRRGWMVTLEIQRLVLSSLSRRKPQVRRRKQVPRGS